MTIFFWAMLGLVIYVYLVYPVCIWLVSKIRPFAVRKEQTKPLISVIIAAYNEEQSIEEKLENTLALDYPRNMVEIIVVSDGSTDSTEAIARGYEEAGVKVVALPTNSGKSEAQNAGIAEASGEILLFADADILLKPENLNNLATWFGDDRVGCVIGRHSFQNVAASGVSRGEGAYWRYESWLRDRESKAGNLAVGSGLLGLRKELASRLDPNVGEDMVLPLRTAIAHKKVVYAKDVVSYSVVLPEQSKDLLSVKARIVSKDLRGLWLNRTILNPIRYPLYSWGLLSHKLLRWLVPFFLIGVLVANCFLLGSTFYLATLIAQLAMYGLAAVGLALEKTGRNPGPTSIPLSFCVVNLAALMGVLRFISGKKSGRWVPVREAK